MKRKQKRKKLDVTFVEFTLSVTPLVLSVLYNAECCAGKSVNNPVVLGLLAIGFLLLGRIVFKMARLSPMLGIILSLIFLGGIASSFQAEDGKTYSQKNGEKVQEFLYKNFGK